MDEHSSLKILAQWENKTTILLLLLLKALTCIFLLVGFPEASLQSRIPFYTSDPEFLPLQTHRKVCSSFHKGS